MPGYQMPESAAIALAHAVRYAAWRSRPAETPPGFSDLQPEEAGALLVAALHDRGDGWLTPDEVRRLLTLYDTAIVEQRVVESAAAAGAAAAELGGEVALKAIAPGLVHKSDVGAVRLGVSGADVATSAAAIAESVRDATGQAPTGFLVQRMAPKGVEMLVGVVNDPQFGPTIACGAGGTLVELLKDISVRLSPLSRCDASEMVRELRTFPLQTGYRGAPVRDVPALEEVVLRLSVLAEDHPQIAEIDCNPVIVGCTGAVVVDARDGQRRLSGRLTYPPGWAPTTPWGVVRQHRPLDTEDIRGNHPDPEV